MNSDAAEIVVAIDEGDPTRRGDLAGHLPGGHRRAPQAEAFAIAVGAPELPRPRVRLAPGVDDAACLGVIEIDAVVQRHALERADGAAETERQRGHLADLRSGFVIAPGSLCRMSAAAMV